MPLSRLQPISRADAPYFRSPGFFVRVGGLAAIVAVGLGVLALRAWSIQILHGPQYTSLAQSQAYRVVDLIGPRGAIVDDKDRLLAGTTGHLVVAADPASLGETGAHGIWAPSAAGLEALRRVGRLAHVPVQTLVTRIERSVIRSPFAPATILPHPENSLIVFIQERAADYPGFKVNGVPSRSYPQGGLGSEFLGLLGEVSQQELGWDRYAHAKAGEVVGQTGIEAIYDSIINPGFIKARLRVDSMGRIAGPLQGQKLKGQLPGLKLTIDARIQRAAQKAVEDGMAAARASGHHPTGGSAVVIDPWTGGIYAMASTPTYNQVRAAKDPRYYASLFNDPSRPLLNRAMQGVYPTGSTFKPIIAEAALNAGIITPDTPLLCSGSFNLGGFVFRNVEAGVYSSMTLHTALAQSCDTWFYRLGDRIWSADPAQKATLIQRWAKLFGLGSTPPIDLVGASPGYIPTPASFLKSDGYPWPEGQTINLAIGQGQLQVSPLQLAVAYSALVNGGTVVRPHLAAAVVRGHTERPLRFKPVRKLKLVDTKVIEQGLYEAAHSPGGTSASVFGTFPVAVAGKTGTAEAPPYGDHSWYASFAPYGHPKVVVVVMIEHGGFGAQAAAPAAKEIYQAFFRLKKTG